MAAPWTSRLDREQWSRTADILATAVAVTLPWSSSGTSIAVVLWLIVLVPTLDWPSLRRDLLNPAGAFPIALVAFGLIGMAWADVALVDRWRGAESFLKLLVIPLLLVQFRASPRQSWPLAGFLASSTALLAFSFVVTKMPHLAIGEWKTYGVPVKDYIAQSAEFSLAAFGLLCLALNYLRSKDYRLAGALALLGGVFLANIFFITSSRTALITVPVLLAAFLLTQFSGRIRAAMIAAGIGIVAVVWFSSPLIRERLTSLPNEIRQFRDAGTRTSAGDRLDFWSKGLAIVGDAPIFGHGTGTIREMYQRAAVDKTGKTIEVTDNPHNQTFAVAIQIGLAGVLVLWAMWFAHFWLFARGVGIAAFVGLAIVAQNVVGSLFNSHLFDFTHGWIYAFGVGVAGGAVLSRSRNATPSTPQPRAR